MLSLGSVYTERFSLHRKLGAPSVPAPRTRFHAPDHRSGPSDSESTGLTDLRKSKAAKKQGHSWPANRVEEGSIGVEMLI